MSVAGFDALQGRVAGSSPTRGQQEAFTNALKGDVAWRLPGYLTGIGFALLALSMWLFRDGLWLEWQAWQEPEYGYAFLILPITVFLIWQQRDRLERIPFTGSWWGIAIMALGGALYLIGELGTIYTVVQYAFVVMLFGVVLSLTGARAFRLLFMPMFILFLTVPLPQFVFANLSTKLQLVSSQLGVDFMRLFSVSVFLQGNVIDLGSYKLQVAEACSGLRYLFPLMTLGFLIAYFYKGAMWKRVLVFLSSVPITVLMNSIRVGIIGITVDRWGIGMAEGFLHEFQGWMVFMICTGLMLAEIAFLNRITHEAGTLGQLFGVDLPAPTPKDMPVRRRAMPGSFLAGAGLLAAFLVISIAVPRPPEIYPSRTTLAQFPLNLGSWRGKSEPLEAIYLDQLKLDDYVLANYANDSGQVLNLYISWYNSQRKGDAVHSPRSCLPGGGWQMVSFDQRSLPDVAVNGQPLRVDRAVIELGNQRQLVYYWFQQRGRIITNEFAAKWYIFLDALTRHRTDGALVRLIVSIPSGSDEGQADARLHEFATRLVRELPPFVPN